MYPTIGVFVAYGDVRRIAELARWDGIEYVEANSRIRFFTDTTHNATRGKRVLDGAIKAKGEVIDGQGVGVAVVDTGVDGTHPDLETRMGGNVRFVCIPPGFGGVQCNGQKTTVELEDTDTPGASGHGTHVAGIVAGTGDASSATYHGAAPGAILYGVGIGTFLFVESALDGLEWVLQHHDQVTPRIRVVNNSWGGGYADPDSPGGIGAVTKMVNLLVDEGITVVFAAGNSGGSGASPTTSAQCVNPKPGVICVANYNDEGTGTRSGSISGTSSRGSEGDPSTWPDISAPGTSVTSTCSSTLPLCFLGSRPGGTEGLHYTAHSGTSMAAPHVAGIVAQLYQANPRLSPARVESLVKNTAHKFSWGAPYRRDPHHRRGTSSFEKGHGLIDALAAVRAAIKSR